MQSPLRGSRSRRSRRGRESPPPPIESRNNSVDEGDEQPRIYAVPTTDTFGDEASLLFRPAPYAVQTPTRYRKPLDRNTPVPRRRKAPPTDALAKDNAQPRRAPTFQHPADAISVKIRTIDLQQRSAFGLSPLVSLDEWQAIADRQARVRQTPMEHRLSPSKLHLTLLHRHQQQTKIRQLHYSPSLAAEADCLYPNTNEDEEANVRDGRYRAVNLLQNLPSTPPLLGHQRKRLPNPADVGFPGATPDQIAAKQREIQLETLWEETTPRLIAISSDDLGTMVEQESSPVFDEWKKSSSKVNRFSMLAPPLDATYSKSQGWRPRPYFDRPPGRKYTLACPIKVALSPPHNPDGPLLGSLTLYSLPVNNSDDQKAFGKMSEHFWFPAGNWDGKIDLDLLRAEDGTMDDALVDAWLDRPHKAILAHNPLDVSDSSLFVVVQLYNMTGEHHVGTQLRTALAVGVARFRGREWPDVRLNEMPLYPSDEAESHERFVERLTRLAQNLVTSPSRADEQVLRASKSVDTAVDETPKKRGLSRLFRSPIKSRSRSVSRAESTVRSVDSPTPIGSCQVYVSNLPVDYLECMLGEPKGVASTNEGIQLPRVLVDGSGDLGIVFRDDAPDSRANKRSDLMRLPVPDQAAAYAGPSEFREVLYLPARPPKHHDVDDPMSFRSMLNLVYIYPRMLRLVGSLSGVEKLSTVTIRVRLVQSRVAIDAETGEPRNLTSPVAAIHNPCPWSGESLLDAVYTHLIDLRTGKRVRASLKEGVSLRDEIKVRLPVVIDGSYSLEFCVYSVEITENDGVGLSLVAEVSIPLSSTVSPDDRPEEKVKTVIPNGNHRLKLGEFQLHLETRLLSALHVGDPAVALALRDMTCAWKDESMLARRSANYDSASASTILAYFPLLLQAHLSTMVASSGWGNLEAHRDLSMENLFSLVRLVEKVSEKLSVDQMAVFWKSVVDWFDETMLVSEDVTLDVDGSDAESQITEILPVAINRADLDVHESEAIRIRVLPSRDRSRRTQVDPTDVSEAAPILRVAYGATKLDRMKLEAERHEGLALYDDDASAAVSAEHFQGDRAAIESSPSSILRLGNVETPRAAKPQANGETEFAERVRSAAKIILAPCVGPMLQNTQSSTKLVPRDARIAIENNPLLASIQESHRNEEDETSPSWWLEGSDVDDQKDGENGATSKVVQTCFRGATDGMVLLSSISFREEGEFPLSRGDYLYESILVLLVNGLHLRPPEANEMAVDSPSRFLSLLPFFLPLCSKSLALRLDGEMRSLVLKQNRLLLDQGSLDIFEMFFRLVARSLVDRATSNTSDDLALVEALRLSEYVVDFLRSLVAVCHSEHINSFLSHFFEALRKSERLDSRNVPEWSPDVVHRVRSSRQLVLHAVEMLSATPAFLALNYPLRFREPNGATPRHLERWSHQVAGHDQPFPVVDHGNVDAQGMERLPASGWLSECLLTEALSVCSLSAEIVITEAMAYVEASALRKADARGTPAPKARPGRSLGRRELVLFQSISIQAITSAYELVLRRHAVDKRFQDVEGLQRVACIHVNTILDRSVEAARWLSRMESTHKVRTTWLLCFVYMLQEAPASLLRQFIGSYCSPNNLRIHRFIRLLRLCSSSFQSFVDLQRHVDAPTEAGRDAAPWLLQECFNTICATTNLVVEEASKHFSPMPSERRKLMHGIMDLLLYVLTTPQSAVTHLRAIGGALQALECCGVHVFLDASGNNLQHWLRVVLGLMNSVSLSVRSIAVDFVISFLGKTFEAYGTVDEVTSILATVLPEVAAREIALQSVSGNVASLDDASRAVWPMRRAFAELEDADPADDDRVDPQLAPSLRGFCRSCQAILDGVIVELRLQGRDCSVVGTRIGHDPSFGTSLDADQESLLEASSFFVAELSPLQKVRWLTTLQALHQSKSQWIEAAEALVACAHVTISSLIHLRHVWRPSRFILWADSRRSLWLDTIGEDVGVPNRGNEQVMEFANRFLEPDELLGREFVPLKTGELAQLSVTGACDMIIHAVSEARRLYALDDSGQGEELAYAQLESLLAAILQVLEEHTAGTSLTSKQFRYPSKARIEEEAAMRRVMATISSELAPLAQDILGTPTPRNGRDRRLDRYALVRLSGKRPSLFERSGTLPTFIEWGSASVCRIPWRRDGDTEAALRSLAHPWFEVLRDELGSKLIVSTETGKQVVVGEDETLLEVLPLDAGSRSMNQTRVKRFRYLKDERQGSLSTFSEVTVAQPFPCALSRQKVLLSVDYNA